MLHLIKLCVGPRDPAQLARLQQARLAATGALLITTRMMPKRAGEILDGGSLYWVMAGFVRVRQRILDIAEAETPDGRRCAAIRLDAGLVTVAARATKPFQGWRYLAPAEAPPDAGAGLPAAQGMEALPPALRAALEEACLI